MERDETKEGKKEREQRLKKAKYDYCKAKGICVICCEEPAFDWHVRCPACMEKASAQKARRTANLTEEDREKIRQQKRDRYWKYKNAGLCANCGKQTCDGKTLCIDCTTKQRKAEKKYRAKKKKGWSEIGLCAWCGSEPVEGKKMCPSCLERNQNLMAYARQFSPKDRPWEWVWK